MYSLNINRRASLQDFRLKGMMMRYSQFMPRLYNLCLSLGFTAGKIVPSRAFCSDESQGFPIILMARHFGTFPFDHGRVGGVVAAGRNGAHAHHGKDLMIVQASHVGYDPQTLEFGGYRRFQTEGEHISTNCGKIMATLDWYSSEFQLAKNSIFLEADDQYRYVVIDNELLRKNRVEGLFLDINKFIEASAKPDRSYSTALRFIAAPSFISLIGDDAWQPNQRVEIGDRLVPELFSFERTIDSDYEGHSFLELNLKQAMPWVLSSEHPALAAAKVNSQMEFDRTYRNILRDPDYRGRNLLFVSGIHIDISPRRNQIFPLTKFIPWAAYHQTESGTHNLYEQAELNDLLRAQSVENPAQIDLEEAIKMMEDELEVLIDVE